MVYFYPLCTMQECTNSLTDSALLNLETVCVKKEEDCNDVTVQSMESTQYNISVKVEPVTAMLTDMFGVTSTSKEIIKEEPIASDRDTDLDDNLFVTNPNWNNGSHLTVMITKESCSSPALDDLISADDVPQKWKNPNIIFNNEQDLSSAMVTHSEIEITVHGSDIEEIISCKVCGLQCPSLSVYLKHRHLHLHEKPFDCEICCKQFNSKYLLTNHERVHTGERPYTCSFCNKTFTELVNLTRHKRTHSGVKPYRCDTCHKSFTLKHNLTLHIRSHTNEKPFECDLCERRFQHVSDLKRHKLTHTGEKRFSCEICHKKFARRYQYVNHSRVHNKKLKSE